MPPYPPQIPFPGGYTPGDYVPSQAGPPGPGQVGGPMPTPQLSTAAPPAAATPPVAAGGAAPAAAGSGFVRPLSLAEQQAILAMLGVQGGTIQGGAAVAETRIGTGLKGPENLPTGTYTIQIADPRSPGAPREVKIAPGDPLPDGSGSSWVPAGTLDKPTPEPNQANNTVKGDDGSTWEKVNGVWTNTGIPSKPSNPDVDRSLALKAQSDQEIIDRRRANAAAGKGYLTDDERFTHDESLRRVGVDEDRIKLDRDKLALQRQNEDAKRQPEIDEIKARTGLAGAQAGLANANVGKITSDVDIAGRKAGPEISEIQARANLANAQARNQDVQATVAGAPTVVPNVGSGPNIYSSNPTTGALSTSLNANYIPKTQAEIAARVGQLQQLAVAKKQELMGKVSATYSPDQAMSEWQSWWDTNVESQKQALAAAQEEAQYARTTAEQTARTAAYTAASSAGTTANTAIDAQSKRRVGPGFAQAAQQVMSGTPLSKIDVGSALTYKAPDQAAAAQAAVQDALKYISPGAAQATGMPMPNYQNVDIQGGLNRLNYAPSFGGTAPGPAAQGGAAPVQGGAAPAPTPGFDWDALMARQEADRALQQRQSQVQFPDYAYGGV